jgi:hypothetical protein
MGKRAADVSGADRPLVAERHQNEQRFFERARPRIAEGEKRRRGRVEHDEIGLAARLKRTDALVEIERTRPTARGEIEPFERRDQCAVERGDL